MKLLAFVGGMRPAPADCAGRESWPHPLPSSSALLWLPLDTPKQKPKSGKDVNATLTGQREGSQGLGVGLQGPMEKSQKAEGDCASMASSPESAQSSLCSRNLEPGMRNSQRVKLSNWKVL